MVHAICCVKGAWLVGKQLTKQLDGHASFHAQSNGKFYPPTVSYAAICQVYNNYPTIISLYRAAVLKVDHVSVESSTGEKLPDCLLVLTQTEVRAI